MIIGISGRANRTAIRVNDKHQCLKLSTTPKKFLFCFFSEQGLKLFH